jgi:hypothetical protein
MTKKRKASRVFILGAGASASCGLPVSQNILNKAMAHLQDHDGAKWGRGLKQSSGISRPRLISL